MPGIIGRLMFQYEVCPLLELGSNLNRKPAKEWIRDWVWDSMGVFVLGLALSYDSAASPLSGTKSSLATKLDGFIITWLRLRFRV